MGSRGNGQSIKYELHASARIRALLEHLHSQAVQTGTDRRFMVALRKIRDCLQHEPLTFGEPQYRLPALHLQLRQGVIAPLVVDYGVYEDRPLVFIRGFKVLS
jgi:hypothetical protein